MNYRHPKARYVAALALASSALAAAACFGERGPGPQPSITEDPTAPVGQPPAVPEPPDAVASATGRRAPLGIGSYCWPADDGGPSACIDRSGIVTAADALPVGRGETVVVNGPGLPWADLREAAVHVRPATDEPQHLDGGWLAWSPEGRSAGVPASRRGDGVAVRADLEPGRWVADVFLRFNTGDVSYGLLLVVR